MDALDCRYLGSCGGCAWGGRVLSEQRQRKLDEVKANFPGVEFVNLESAGLRDKVDLVWEEGRLGLYMLGKEEAPTVRQILDLESCPMMSAKLEEFFHQYRQRKPPIRKGSVRLRISPTGERGVWLDFANQDIKTLFDEKSYLQWLSSIAFVEIGQRRKVLIWKEGSPKLAEPVLKPWFETYGSNGEAIPLFGPVGGFSQTGFAANRALVTEVLAQVKKSGVTNWVELFCGNGNFTLAMAAEGYQVEAVEMDQLAVAGIENSLAQFKSKNISQNVQFRRADVYLKTQSLPSLGGRGLLVDPPRAGLREVLGLLSTNEKPKALVYVSCFTEVLNADLARLKELGFRLQQLTGVDQFPHSPHAEWVALLTHG